MVRSSSGESAARLLRVGGQQQQRAEEGVNDLRGLERLALGLGFELVQQAHALVVEHGQAALEHRLHQRLLRAEVVIHGREIHAGRASDLAHRRAVMTLLGEQRLGSVQDGFPG